MPVILIIFGGIVVASVSLASILVRPAEWMNTKSAQILFISGVVVGFAVVGYGVLTIPDDTFETDPALLGSSIHFYKVASPDSGICYEIIKVKFQVEAVTPINCEFTYSGKK